MSYTIDMNSQGRYFFALMPQLEVAHELYQAASEVLEPFGCEPNPIERLHITLTFLGPLNRQQLDLAIQIGDSIQANRFKLAIDSIKHWHKHPMLWFTPSQPSKELIELHQNLHEKLTKAGFDLDKCAYRPHITFSRRKLDSFSHNVNTIPWPVKHFQLMQSTTIADKSQYRLIKQWNLSPYH